MTARETKSNEIERVHQVVREDLTMFINACFACTGQREYYSNAFSRNVSIAFLHEYILGNYRLLYARTLAAGINHFNQMQIILNLLATGRHTSAEHRADENALIDAALRGLPPQRAWKLWQQARRRGINNRRTRALVRDYLASRPNQSFEVVKYRAKVRAISLHAHLKLADELGRFLFQRGKQAAFETPLFETFRQAHYTAEAIYGLPFTVAEGLARKHSIPRAQFLARIQPQMTPTERLRLQDTAAELPRVDIQVDWGRLPLTKLAIYILSLSIEARREKRDELTAAMGQAARNVLRRAPMRLSKVAAILDCSYSSSGSSEKRRRPLGVALAAHALLETASREYRPFWTLPPEESLLVQARGQTDLVTPLLNALDWQPDLIVIVSDGYENDPPCGADEALRVFRTRLDARRRTAIVHCNPVFAEDDFAPHALSSCVPTVGLRDAEDLPTVLGFARFADGSATRAELEEYLAARAQQMLAAMEQLPTKK